MKRGWALVATVAVAAMVGLGGCRDRYGQGSPQALIASAQEMVRKGKAERLPDLIYADTRQMRELLTELGVVLGSVQELGREVQRAFPDEVARLKQQAAEAAARGESSSLIARLTQSATGRPARGAPRPGGEMEAGFNQLMQQIFADPYGWLEASGDRLGFESIADDTAVVTWDGKPVLPPAGLVLKEKDGRWYVAIPTNFPGASRIMPSTPEGWEILGSLMAALDNAVRDTTRDIRSGKAKRLEDVARAAGEKAIIPAGLAFFAYERAKEAERREAREKQAGAAPPAGEPKPPGGG